MIKRMSYPCDCRNTMYKFTRGHQKMVQDIYPHKLHNEFDPNVQATQEDVLLCIVNGRILIHLNCFENKEVVFPKVSDIQVENVEYRYLFSIDMVQKTICLRPLLENIWQIGIEILNSVEDVDIRWCIQQQKERWFVQSVTIQSIQELCRL